jgi:hypothetical protein
MLVASFTPQPLYPGWSNLRYQLDRRFGGPKAGLNNMEKLKFLTLPGLELRPIHSQPLYRLPYPSSLNNKTK